MTASDFAAAIHNVVIQLGNAYGAALQMMGTENAALRMKNEELTQAKNALEAERAAVVRALPHGDGTLGDRVKKAVDANMELRARVQELEDKYLPKPCPEPNDFDANDTAYDEKRKKR